jgi:predicted unusual protein kinase regulating ubiquinone biosynthesis (AarF/ABC1/UbiB family)
VFGRAAPLPRRALVRRVLRVGSVSARHAARSGWRRRDRLAGLRGAIEELGPSWVKVGQLVAASPGSFPPAVVDALKSLHDGVAPQSPEATTAVLDAELASWRTDFVDFSLEPVAAGSVAQVHAARLRDGQRVAVKVQRDGIVDSLEADLRLLRSIAASAVRIRPRLDALRIVEAIDDLALGLEEELDFRRELENMALLTPLMTSWGIRVPRTIERLSGPRVLVMEWVDAVPVRDPAVIAGKGGRPDDILRRVLGSLLESAFVLGRFHADGHGGNVMVGDDGAPVLVDFGIVGRVTPEQQKACAVMLDGIFTGRFEMLGFGMAMLPEMAHAPPEAGAALAEVAGRHITGSLSDMKMGVLLREALETANAHGVPLPASMVLLFKQILYFDGLAAVLAPDFDLFGDGSRYSPMLTAVAAGAPVTDQSWSELALGA